MFEKPKMKGWYAMKRRNMNDGLRYWNGRQWSLIAWPTETALIALITACKEDATFCGEEGYYELTGTVRRWAADERFRSLISMAASIARLHSSTIEVRIPLQGWRTRNPPMVSGWYEVEKDVLRFWNGEYWSELVVVNDKHSALEAMFRGTQRAKSLVTAWRAARGHLPKWATSDSFISFMNCLPCRLAGMNDLVHINDLTEKPKK